MLFDLLNEKHGRGSHSSQHSLHIVLFVEKMSTRERDSFGLHLVATVSSYFKILFQAHLSYKVCSVNLDSVSFSS